MNDRRCHYDYRVDVAGTGFTVLDRIYADGGLADEALGGSCGNVLVSLAMLHRQVAPVLALGNDDEGQRLVHEFIEAGALIHYINRRSDLRSPVIAQELDTSSGQHKFSYVCPETLTDLPRYQPIGKSELGQAMPMLAHCNVFYTDRVSDSIIDAMRVAKSAGAIIFFEPSSIDDEELFAEALGMVSILKYSEDRLGERLANWHAECIRIITYGAAGLEVRDDDRVVWCEAIYAPKVIDTCGSGDMVSVGVIDWVLTNQLKPSELKTFDLLEGVVAGQRLAAENCAYAGARGLFKTRGAEYVRSVLGEHGSATILQRSGSPS